MSSFDRENINFPENHPDDKQNHENSDQKDQIVQPNNADFQNLHDDRTDSEKLEERIRKMVEKDKETRNLFLIPERRYVPIHDLIPM